MMEIRNRHSLDYSNKVQANQTAKAEEATKSKEKDKSEMILTPKDEYISSGKSGKKPGGLYHMGQDENGNPKIVFDARQKAEESGSEQTADAKLREASDNGRVKVTIGNMDKVKKKSKS